MTLGEILKGRSNIRVKEYERWGDGLIFVGGCYYGDDTLIQIDRTIYSANMEINAYEWRDNNVLMIVREKHDY